MISFVKNVYVCVYVKQYRITFPKEQSARAKHAEEMFHGDLCGKMNQPSIGGSYYFLLLKDGYSRYCYIYFLKEKTDRYNIKRLRTDCDKKFHNRAIKNYLFSKNIRHETTDNTDLQNRFIERQNTIVKST